MGYCTLPGLQLITAKLRRLDAEQEFVLVKARVTHQDDVVSEYFDFFTKCRLLLDLRDAVERVSHYGDQQIQESYLSDERRSNEQEPNRTLFPVSTGTVIAQRQQVLVDYSVYDFDTKYCIIKLLVGCFVLVHNIHSISKCHQDEDETDQEVFYVVDCLENQLDVK